METEQKTITDKIVEGLKKATVEIEEFQLQFALGKADAKDVYEDLKRKFNLKMHDLKQTAHKLKDQVSDDADKLKAAFEELQLQLALGKADTKDLFEEQRKSILKALHKIESAIKENETANSYYVKLLEEIEKFKIKLEILRLRFELKKFDVSSELEGRKSEFNKLVNEIRTKMMYKESNGKKQVQHFKDEISEAYLHLKNAFSF